MIIMMIIINPFTAMMSHKKKKLKNCEFETLECFVSFLALACERVFIKTHSVESRCVTGPENTLFADASVHISARKFYRLGQ